MANEINFEKSLTELLMDADFEKLESQLTRFNIFEAVGVGHHELRHSAFLAYLLDPNQMHGLGDLFARKFLQQVLRECRVTQPISPIELDLWTLDQLTVRREWKHIDILMEDPTHKLVVIIENKVFSYEHDDQLRRYWDTVNDSFPEHKIMGIYLSPDPNEPLEIDDRFIRFSYKDIHKLINQITESGSSKLGPAVMTLLGHYNVLLERHIMDNPKIDELCKQIYRKHKQAIDLIIEKRPDQISDLQELIIDLVKHDNSLELGSRGRTYLSFRPKEWDSLKLKAEYGWILLFEVRLSGSFDKGKYSLYLVIGPGDRDIREKLYEMACKNTPLKGYRPLGSTSTTIWKHNLIEWRDEDFDFSKAQEELEKNWNDFMKKELPRILDIIKKQSFTKS